MTASPSLASLASLVAAGAVPAAAETGSTGSPDTALVDFKVLLEELQLNCSSESDEAVEPAPDSEDSEPQSRLANNWQTPAFLAQVITLPVPPDIAVEARSLLPPPDTNDLTRDSQAVVADPRFEPPEASAGNPFTPAPDAEFQTVTAKPAETPALPLPVSALPELAPPALPGQTAKPRVSNGKPQSAWPRPAAVAPTRDAQADVAGEERDSGLQARPADVAPTRPAAWQSSIETPVSTPPAVEVDLPEKPRRPVQEDRAAPQPRFANAPAESNGPVPVAAAEIQESPPTARKADPPATRPSRKPMPSQNGPADGPAASLVGVSTAVPVQPETEQAVPPALVQSVSVPVAVPVTPLAAREPVPIAQRESDPRKRVPTPSLETIACPAPPQETQRTQAERPEPAPELPMVRSEGATEPAHPFEPPATAVKPHFRWPGSTKLFEARLLPTTPRTPEPASPPVLSRAKASAAPAPRVPDVEPPPPPESAPRPYDESTERRESRPSPGGPATAQPPEIRPEGQLLDTGTVARPSPLTAPGSSEPHSPVRTASPALEDAPQPERIAHPVADPPRTAAAKEIRLEIPGGEQRVAVRLTERSGVVHVAVRTPDGRLESDLRENLPSLSARLESSGYRAESWRTDTAHSETMLRNAEGPPSGNPDEFNGQRQGSGDDQDRPGQRRPRHHLEEETTQEKKEEFSWFASNLQ